MGTESHAMLQRTLANFGAVGEVAFWRDARIIRVKNMDPLGWYYANNPDWDHIERV